MICSTLDRGAGVPEPPDGLIGRGQVEDELGLAARDGPCDLPGLGVGDLQVEDQVLPGDLTQRLGATDVEGVLVAELPVELRAAGDGLFEVEGVGGVEAVVPWAMPS